MNQKLEEKNSYLQYGFILIIKNAIKIVHDEVFHEQIKNIEIDCHFIHHYTFHGLLLLDSISSIDQFIGILTKFLSPYHLCTFFFFFFLLRNQTPKTSWAFIETKKNTLRDITQNQRGNVFKTIL